MMNFTPNLLGIFENIYGSESVMTIPKALLVALVGFITVVFLLTFIALFIKFIAFIFSIVTKKKAAPAPKTTKPAPAHTATTGKTVKTLRSEIKLIDVDEPTAAVIMALVSHNSGIPLEKLDFKSIKPLEDK